MFWIHANSRTQFEHAFTEIAGKLKITGFNDPQADVLRQVFRWLDDELNGSWLVILDNADDSDVLNQPQMSGIQSENVTSLPSPSLMDLIPQKPHGKVLITSRDRATADDLVGDYGDLIEVVKMSPSESLDLLATKLRSSTFDRADAIELLNELEHLPLAIAQAGAYIRQQAAVMTVSRYLTQFRLSSKNQTSLLKNGLKDYRRNPNVPNAVITTWEISFNQIRNRNPLAAHLLSLMAMFNRQNLPAWLLRKVNRNDEGLKADNGKLQSHDEEHEKKDEDLGKKDKESNDIDELEFLNAINVLLSFSLITARSEDGPYDMHRLVQIAARIWLQDSKPSDLRYWEAQALQILAQNLPSGLYEEWDVFELLLPHAEEVISYATKSGEGQPQLASLLVRISSYFYEKGNFDRAAKADERRSSIYVQQLGIEHPCTLDSFDTLISSYIEQQSQWKVAEELIHKAVALRQRVQGVEHPDTLSTLSLQAKLRLRQQRWSDAESLYIELQEKMAKVLGKEDKKSLRLTSRLAELFMKQGRFEEAEKVLLDLLNVRTYKLGGEGLQTLRTLRDLAYVHRKQGHLEKAEELSGECLRRRTNVLGAEHPSTISIAVEMAVVYNKQRRWKEAEKILEPLLEVSKRVLGDEHSRTLAVMAALADTWSSSKDRMAEAEQLQLRVLEADKRLFGADHPNTLNGMASLATIYCDQGYTSKAIELMTECWERETRTKGAQHYHTVDSLKRLNKWKAKTNELPISMAKASISSLQAVDAEVNMTDSNSYNASDRGASDEADSSHRPRTSSD